MFLTTRPLCDTAASPQIDADAHGLQIREARDVHGPGRTAVAFREHRSGNTGVVCVTHS